MNALHELQHGFVQAVFDKTDAKKSRSDFNQTIIADGLSGERRLQVYSNNIYRGLTDALIAVYPVIYRLVGEEFFRYMGREYIVSHPSQSGDLHKFGDQLEAFIKDFEPASGLIYLPDVAKLEWSYHLYFSLQKAHILTYQNYTLSVSSSMSGSSLP